MTSVTCAASIRTLQSQDLLCSGDFFDPLSVQDPSVSSNAYDN